MKTYLFHLRDGTQKTYQSETMAGAVALYIDNLPKYRKAQRMTLADLMYVDLLRDVAGIHEVLG